MGTCKMTDKCGQQFCQPYIPIIFYLIVALFSEEIEQSSEDVLWASINHWDTQGRDYRKNLCLLDLSLETTLNFWRSLGSLESFAFLKRLFLLRISWIMSLVSHRRFFLLGKKGMHSSMMSRNIFFQFDQIDWMSLGSITVSKFTSISQQVISSVKVRMLVSPYFAAYCVSILHGWYQMCA